MEACQGSLVAFFLKQINFIGLKSSNRTATSHMYRVTFTQERSHNSLQIVSDVKRKAKMYATPQGARLLRSLRWAATQRGDNSLM